MKNIAAVILAAGRGTRMNSGLPKVLHSLHARPLLSFALEILEAVGVKKKVLVVGYGGKDVKNTFKDLDTVTQKRLLGSGDAVKRTGKFLANFKGDILVLYGDTPFIRKETIERLIKVHREKSASCTLLSARVSAPSGYGRIIRNENDAVVKIVEEKDASSIERSIDEINIGCYCFNKSDLFSCLKSITINRRKREYYLTDVIEMLAQRDKKVVSLICEDPVEAFGVNSRAELAEANTIMRKKILSTLMQKGVTIVDPDSVFVDTSAKIGKDTVIHPHTVIERDVIVGKNCQIGPFARLRQGTVIADSVEIGNFVELVRTKVSSKTKIKHMSYLGDAEVGTMVNIGAGTITANFDGKKKNKTVIKDKAFIGVGAILIAPVKIGYGAIVGAGSVVTKHKDVPPHKTVVGIPARLLSGRGKK